MPNHVTTGATITGPKKAIDQFASTHFTMSKENNERGERAHLRFDFNTVIPRPACLEGIESGSNTERGVEALTGKPYHEAFTGMLAAIHKSVASGFVNRPMPTPETATPEQLEAGRKALAAIAECGYPTWYEWCNERWGTKWNAYNSTGPMVNPAIKPKGHAVLHFSFDSAWDTPRGVWDALAKMYPTLHFELYLDGEIDQPETIRFGPAE